MRLESLGITQDQITEWTENPVTQAFKKLAEQEAQELSYVKGVDAYHPFEPQRTQEVLANLNGCVDTWDVVMATLDGEGLWESEDDDAVSDEIGY